MIDAIWRVEGEGGFCVRKIMHTAIVDKLCAMYEMLFLVFWFCLHLHLRHVETAQTHA